MIKFKLRFAGFVGNSFGLVYLMQKCTCGRVEFQRAQAKKKKKSKFSHFVKT